MDPILAAMKRNGFHEAASRIALGSLDQELLLRAWDLFEKSGFFLTHGLQPFIAPPESQGAARRKDLTHV